MSEEFPAAEMHRGIRSMLDKDKRIAELEEALDLSMCAYCGFTVKKSESKENPFPLADHILSCEKSPMALLAKRQSERIAELEAQVEKMRKEHEHIAKREEHICEQCNYVLGCDNAFLASEALKEAEK